MYENKTHEFVINCNIHIRRRRHSILIFCIYMIMFPFKFRHTLTNFTHSTLIWTAKSCLCLSHSLNWCGTHHNKKQKNSDILNNEYLKLLFFLLVSSHQKEHLFFICLFIQTVLDEFFVCVYKSKCAFTNNEVYFITSQSVLLTICYVVTIFSTSNVMSVKSVEFLFHIYFSFLILKK